MDPAVAATINTAFAQSVLIANNDHTTRMGRQADTALAGLKVIEGVVAKELLVSDDPGDMSRLNAAIRVPTTLDHGTAAK